MPTQRTSMGNQQSASGTGVTDGQQRSAQANRSSRTHGHHQRSHQGGLTGTSAHRQHPTPSRFSKDSSPAIPDSSWFASDFMVGAGMVILQPSTGCVVLLRNIATRHWFLPKGRKDVGESLEQTALREAYEESGFKAQFLPLYTPTNAPPSPLDRLCPYVLPNTEPIYISTKKWRPRKQRPDRLPRPGDNGGEYLTFWYVGQIAEDACPRFDANMPDEEKYITHLMPLADAVRLLWNDRAFRLTTIELERLEEAAASSTTDSDYDESSLASQDFPAVAMLTDDPH
ncbi:hypothetical protein B0H21DRAFT_747560 [Amylocystis lapponica]|nr:hypothetical protein B0H21DRAFT_747560 [Amylocystis lapponica]